MERNTTVRTVKDTHCREDDLKHAQTFTTAVNGGGG